MTPNQLPRKSQILLELTANRRPLWTAAGKVTEYVTSNQVKARRSEQRTIGGTNRSHPQESPVAHVTGGSGTLPRLLAAQVEAGPQGAVVPPLQSGRTNHHPPRRARRRDEATGSARHRTMSGPIVSMVRDATATETRDEEACRIIFAIRSFKHRAQVDQIRAEYQTALADGRDAKKAVAELKKSLPGVLWSGQFKTRDKNVAVEERLVRHSGLLCADLDDLGDCLAKVRALLLTSPHLWALFTSPTGTGLKAIFRVRPDAALHLASYRAVERHVHHLVGVQIDAACKDLARLCFVSFDPEVRHNP